MSTPVVLSDGHHLGVGISIGAALYPEQGRRRRPCCSSPTTPCIKPNDNVRRKKHTGEPREVEPDIVKGP